MRRLKEFDIQYFGLAQAEHSFNYTIDNKFFEYFGFFDYNSSNVKVDALLNKKSTLIELYFSVSGFVNVLCDISLEPFNQEISGKFKLIVKFGTEYNDDDDEILILPYEEYQVNVAQYIYELIILSVPVKRIHPKVLNETLDSDTLKKLRKLEIKKNTTRTVDPRWDKLKDLLTDKKT